MDEKRIKPLLNGSAERMLQSFYARAMYSKNPNNKFKDAKAEEIVSICMEAVGKHAAGAEASDDITMLGIRFLG